MQLYHVECHHLMRWHSWKFMNIRPWKFPFIHLLNQKKTDEQQSRCSCAPIRRLYRMINPKYFSHRTMRLNNRICIGYRALPLIYNEWKSGSVWIGKSDRERETKRMWLNERLTFSGIWSIAERERERDTEKVRAKWNPSFWEPEQHLLVLRMFFGVTTINTAHTHTTKSWSWCKDSSRTIIIIYVS